MGPTAIGRVVGRSSSTISRELRRNLHSSGQYRPFNAHGLAAAREGSGSRHDCCVLSVTPGAAVASPDGAGMIP
ncbi:MAG: helix-turn-helix domain-containing protein [Promicromonosporaceae bacterium]|nr:helix-turn-helix domain-containing protein [Promicromonosporaceae bacterium]